MILIRQVYYGMWPPAMLHNASRPTHWDSGRDFSNHQHQALSHLVLEDGELCDEVRNLLNAMGGLDSVVSTNPTSFRK